MPFDFSGVDFPKNDQNGNHDRKIPADRKSGKRGHQLWRLLPVLLAVMFSAAGCSAALNGISVPDWMAGMSDSADLPVLQPDKSASNTVLIEDRGPAEGGTLRLFMQPPDSFDPLVSLDPYVMDYGWFLYDPLVTVTAGGQVVPFLAISLQSFQEGRIWDVTIRDNIRFHDGTELTAQDVAFSAMHARNGQDGGPYEISLSNLDSAEVVGRDRVRLILKAPDSRFSVNLGFPILPAHAWKEGTGEAGESLEPVGTGAYRYSLRDDGGITLVRNADWWNIAREGGIGHPIWPESVRFVFGNGEADRVTYFQQRRIDVSWTQLADKSRYMNRKDIEYREYLGNRMEFAIMGAKGSGIRMPAVRTILLRYLAGCALEEGALAGEPVAAEGLEPISLEEAIPLLEAAGCKFQQPAQERRVLLVPGNSGWRQASLVIRYDSLNLERLKTAEWMTDMFGRLGVTVTREEATKKEEQKLLTTGQFDMMLLGCISPVGMMEDGMITAMRESVGGQVSPSDVMPLYRERRAMLYSTRIRGEKNPTAGNVYGGWAGWYLLTAATESASS